MILVSKSKRIERYVVDLVEQKKWEEAHDFLTRNPDALRDRRSFLRRKVEREASFSSSESGRRLAHPDFVRQRLAPHLDMEAWSIGDIGDVRGGLIGARNLRITLRNRSDAAVLTLFEKVYSEHDRSKAVMETALFEDVDSQALLSPRFHGAYAHDNFDSLFFDFIDGAPVADARSHRLRAVRTLWNARPTERLVKKYGHRLVPLIGRYTDRPQFARLGTELGMRNHRLFDTRRMLEDDLPRILSDAPLCVMHEDMRPQNFLTARASGTTYLIDWEKWNIRPVGFGLRLRADEFEHFLSHLPGRANGIPAPAQFPAFRFLVAFGSLLHHLEMNRPSDCAAWIPVVAHELDALG